MKNYENRITEYHITYINGSHVEDVITEIKEEAEDIFEETKKNVSQYFRKDYLMVETAYEEDFVEVYYTK